MMRARRAKEEDGQTYISFEPKEDCVWMFDDMQFNIFMDASIGHRSIYKGRYSRIKVKEFPYETEYFYRFNIREDEYDLKITISTGWKSTLEDGFHPGSFLLLKDGIYIIQGEMYDLSEKIDDYIRTKYFLEDWENRITVQQRNDEYKRYWIDSDDPDDYKVGGKHHLIEVVS